MIPARHSTVLQQVRTLSALARVESQSDAELLHDFLNNHNQDAFAALVRRHGPMVLSVCRRILRHQQDTEDAFQATFLALARKARTVRNRGSLAAWLHGTASRTALNILRAAARRRAHEERAACGKPTDPAAQLCWKEVQELFLQEVLNLPEKYRIVFALCYLDGMGRAEAGRLLGLPEGTVCSRLDTARKRLHDRLASRGVALAAVLGTLALANQAEARIVPSALVAATTRAACKTAFESGTTIARVIFGFSLVLVLGTFAGLGLCLTPRSPEEPEPVLPQTASRVEPPVQASRVDLHGDPLPDRAIARLGTVRFRHGSMITALSYLPDGKTILSTGYDKLLRLWDVNSGRELRQFAPPHFGSFTTLSLSADGKRFAAKDYGGSIVLGDLANGQLIESPERGPEVGGSLALSPDGKVLAVLSPLQVRLVDTRSGKVLATWENAKGSLLSLAFSPDSKTLATGADDGKVLLRDVSAATVSLRLECPGPVYSLAFSPNGKIVGTGWAKNDHGKLRLWESATGKLLREIGDHYPHVEAIAFTADSKLVASSGGRDATCIWDTATGKELHRCWAYAEGISFSPDGKTLATGGNDGTVRLWNVATGKEQLLPASGHQGTVATVAASRDGRLVVTGGGEERTLRVWDPLTGKELRRIDASSTWFLGAMALSADGKIVATDKGLWDVASGRFLAGKEGRGTIFADQDYSIEALAFSPDARLLAMATRSLDVGRDRMIRLWDTTKFKEVRHFGTLPVRALAYSPDGSILAAGNEDGRWDFGTRQPGKSATTSGHTGATSTRSPFRRTANSSPRRPSRGTSACGTRPAASRSAPWFAPNLQSELPSSGWLSPQTASRWPRRSSRGIRTPGSASPSGSWRPGTSGCVSRAMRGTCKVWPSWGAAGSWYPEAAIPPASSGTWRPLPQRSRPTWSCSAAGNPWRTMTRPGPTKDSAGWPLRQKGSLLCNAV